MRDGYPSAVVIDTSIHLPPSSTPTACNPRSHHLSTTIGHLYTTSELFLPNGARIGTRSVTRARINGIYVVRNGTKVAVKVK